LIFESGRQGNLLHRSKDGFQGVLQATGGIGDPKSGKDLLRTAGLTQFFDSRKAAQSSMIAELDTGLQGPVGGHFHFLLSIKD
jgi:hypothetical protein